MHDRWLTVKEAAQRVSRSPKYVHHLIRSGRVTVRREITGRPLRSQWVVEPQSLCESVLRRGEHRATCDCVRCVPAGDVDGARIRMPAAMRQALKQEAKALNTSVAEVIRTAVELYLSEGGQAR